MRIALDYDDTYTKDPKLWNNFIDDCINKGHEIMIVTYRSPDLPIDHDLKIGVHYTSWHAKKKFMEDKGYPIDIWIDDHPEFVLYGEGTPYST